MEMCRGAYDGLRVPEWSFTTGRPFEPETDHTGGGSSRDGEEIRVFGGLFIGSAFLAKAQKVQQTKTTENDCTS
jgi:hypothetical protein